MPGATALTTTCWEHLRALPDRTYDGPNAVSAEFSRT
jgi:hypothetical protein